MGIDSFENSYHFHIAHDTKIKRLLRKDEIQGTAKKTWSKGEAKAIPVRYCLNVLFSQAKGL